MEIPIKNELNISLIQCHILWQNKLANYEHISELINSISETDIIVLPEMFATGFSMNVKELAETMEGETIDWMRKTANKKNCVVAGSVIILDNNQYFNRFVWMLPDGNYQYYDKRHLFRMSNEHLYYSSGDKRLIINYKGWRICPQICYDLRFPVWSRNRNDYDLLIYIASWPQPRNHAWRTLLLARAIENQCYTIGVNRIGEGGNNANYDGYSAIISPLGEYIFDAPKAVETVRTEQISLETLRQFRNNFPANLDADNFSIL